MKKICVALSLMMVICVSHANIFKWIDSKGNVHFSDRPHAGAKKLNIPKAQIFSSPVQQPIIPEKLTPNNFETYKVSIAQPKNEATIRNNQGNVLVKVRMEPNLQPKDKLQLLFDGNPMGKPQKNLLFKLSGIYRGSHTITVQIIDAEGEVLNRSEPITIFMFRPRIEMRTNSLSTARSREGIWGYGNNKNFTN